MWAWPLLAWVSIGVSHPADSPEHRFEEWTGSKLVFTRAETPNEVLYATTPELSRDQRRVAADILLREARQYPRGLFGKVGLHTVAVFAGCGDPNGDGFRPWVDALKGYRYFGRWDSVGAIVACYYEDGQLPLTFHHEVFHHLDATKAHRVDYRHFTADDRRFRAAITGSKPYPALALSVEDRQSLLAISTGEFLEEAVGRYSEKSAGEDQAETARWLQTHLADGLLQASDMPELAGSQRILHLLEVYRTASSSLTTRWWVSAALLRAERLSAQRRPDRGVAEILRPTSRANPYLAKVDEVIDDPAVAGAIRRVQPAAVRLSGGSGVNLASSGLILTNAHVVDAYDREVEVSFPDGQSFTGAVVAWSEHFDLALVALDGAAGLPVARLAPQAPRVGDTVVAIGQPGTRTPAGKPTGYEPWHVSVGQIRGFLPELLGRQSLGRAKHSAWTYWGHSGSPLFSVDGEIVALHNSWDSKTAMRHAVPWEAIMRFLRDHHPQFAKR